jgi:hypothetical protein
VATRGYSTHTAHGVVGRWASGRTQLAWHDMVELGPQRHGARRGGSGR